MKFEEIYYIMHLLIIKFKIRFIIPYRSLRYSKLDYFLGSLEKTFAWKYSTGKWKWHKRKKRG